jgi:hypothetical protein
VDLQFHIVKRYGTIHVTLDACHRAPLWIAADILTPVMANHCDPMVTAGL